MENPMVTKLRKMTNEALRRKEEKDKERREREIKEVENLHKKSMHELFVRLVTEKKLSEIAEKGLSEYPLLFITDDESKRPVKNRRTGYKYNIGKKGEFLFQEIIDNGFTPAMIKVDQYAFKEGGNNSEIVVREGYYLGIKW